MQQVHCRLIVGADGRKSTVRTKLESPLTSAEPSHLFSGTLWAMYKDGRKTPTQLRARADAISVRSFRSVTSTPTGNQPRRPSISVGSVRVQCNSCSAREAKARFSRAE